MRLRQIINPNFKAAMSKLIKQDVPLRVAFKLKQTTKTMNDAIKHYDEIRKEALTKYGSKDINGEMIIDSGGNIAFEQDKLRIFNKEIEDLLNSDIEITKLSIEDLGDIRISADDLFLFDDFIV